MPILKAYTKKEGEASVRRSVYMFRVINLQILNAGKEERNATNHIKYMFVIIHLLDTGFCH